MTAESFHRFFFRVLHVCNYIYRMAADCERLPGVASGDKSDARRRPLPTRHRAGLGFFFLIRIVLQQQLLQDRFTASDLRDDGINFFPVVRDATVCSVIAIPARCRKESIELGKIQRRNMPRGAVNEQPSSGLPLPMRRRIFREAVVDPEGSLHDEQTISHIVNLAERKFLQPCVHKHRAKFQGQRLIFRITVILNCIPFAKSDDVRLGCRGGSKTRERKATDENLSEMPEKHGCF